MFWQVVIAVAAGWVLWKIMTSIIRMLVNPPPEPDPTDVIDAETLFRCGSCGTEVIMTVKSNTEDAFPPPLSRTDGSHLAPDLVI